MKNIFITYYYDLFLLLFIINKFSQLKEIY